MNEFDKSKEELIDELNNIKHENKRLQNQINDLYNCNKQSLDLMNFQMLFENAVDGIALGSPKGIITKVNKAFSYMLQIPKEEIIGKHITELPFDKNNLKEHPFRFDLLHQGKTIQNYRILNVSNGTQLHVEMRTNMMPDGSYQSFYRDVSERLKTELALYESEQRFRFLAENAKDMLFKMTYPEGRYEYVSPASFDILGCMPEELYETPALIFKSIHPDYIEYLNEKWDLLRENFVEPIYEYKIINNKTGDEKWLRQSNSGIFDENGKLISIEGIISDITDRKNSEEEVKESENRFRELFDFAVDGLIISSNQGEILNINKAFCEILKLKKEDVIGKNVRDLPFEIESVKANPFRYDLLEKGEIVQTFRSMKRTDGTIINVEMRSKKMPDSSFQTIYRDISERVHAEEELRLNESRLDTLVTLSQMSYDNLNELTDFTLENAVRLTCSKIGYLAFLNEEETIMTMYSWSKNAMKNCMIDDKPIVYPVESTGLWGEAVRQRKPIVTNDYQQDNPYKKGYPAGHITIVRHMNIPVFDNNKIVAIVGVGNKSTNYNEGDIRQLTLLMEGMWRIIQRKKNEDAIKSNEEKFRKLIQNSNDIFTIIDKNGIEVYISSSLERLTGIKPEEQLGKNIYEIVHPDDFKKISEIFTQCVQTPNQVFSAEFRHLCKDGNYIYFESIGQNMLDDPLINGIIVNTRDISERRKNEQELLEQTEQLKRFEKIVVGREIKMIELKKQISELEKKIMELSKHGN